jgi:DNA polymerase-4
VLERTRLWCSVGVGDTKIRAKLASGFAKPRGVFVLTAATWFEVMGPQPTDALWGVGAKTARKLAVAGIRTIEQLATTDDERLAAAFGPNTGPWLRRLGTGEDGSPVTDEPHVARGHGRERTFQRDLTEPEVIRAEVARLATEVMADVRREGRPVVRVVVKVRFAPFFTSSHGVGLGDATSDAARIATGARDALDRFDLDRPVRLLGVRVEFERPVSSS